MVAIKDFVADFFLLWKNNGKTFITEVVLSSNIFLAPFPNRFQGGSSNRVSEGLRVAKNEQFQLNRGDRGNARNIGNKAISLLKMFNYSRLAVHN